MLQALRSTAFMIWLVGLTVILGIIAAPTVILPKRFVWFFYDLWIAWVSWGFERLIGVTVEIKGREHIPDHPVLVASKHQAMWDTITVFRLFGTPAVILKQELMWVPIYGWYAARLGMISIDRGAHASALRKMVAQARARLDEGRSVVIFPEGSRAPVGGQLDYKPGVAALYRQLDVPCLPVALNSGRCWPRKGYGFKPGTITLEVLEPIPPGLNRKDFMATLEERIETASRRLADL